MPDRIVYVVDDDAAVRDSLSALLESAGLRVASFGSAGEFLAIPGIRRGGCVIADIRMPDMDGLALQELLARDHAGLPVIIITGHGDVPLAVRAMKAGAVDFIEKPFDDEVLLASVARALEVGKRAGEQAAAASEASAAIAQLTPRERQVLEQLVAGRANKVIAFELKISPRTVEIHRANLMDKMGSRSLSELVRKALAAGITPAS